jgi:hypothetical protein
MGHGGGNGIQDDAQTSVFKQETESTAEPCVEMPTYVRICPLLGHLGPRHQALIIIQISIQ